MIIKSIQNDEELKSAFQRLETVFQAEADTPEAEEMEMLVNLIEAYENKHYEIMPPASIEAINSEEN
ncbi:MAG: hypothetical protein Q8N35_05765 [Methylococcaceae bacterium]|nr:hypothetical protein [Methylococcaceae bacterium]MDZ4156346.1 hypothetical protein [Methylococcales bacterium]MDP2394607.1 hypothetical protein [Methylococcaceae bacterium]MDP3019075.1 hypothetical protein [Methylococcaceae bacterium]MDP3390291.1 hypothetical protein [Methylococcaceae bacterium]